jgi:hypothetical protein
MRPAKPPKLPGHLTPIQKRRLRKFWRDIHDASPQLVLALNLPDPKPPRPRRSRRVRLR